MIQELLFTSYEGQGLRKGGGGFCTVLNTEGMAANTASALEKLSGYKHPFDLHDDRSLHNPVNYRHAVLMLGGTSCHVLSRIADLRHEHTGRSNKLAHHVVLGKSELPPGGPAHTLRHPGFSRTDWDRQVRLVPPPALASLPTTEAQPVRCDAWARATGDAGWAGAVAEELAASADAAAHVIFPLKTDCLALVDEVLRLLPPHKRWSVGFSTYYTAPIPGSGCNLRFVLDGTPEAEKIRRDHRLWKVDLASSLSRAPESPLAIAARTGELTHAAVPAKPKLPARGARPGKSAASEDEDDLGFVQSYPFDGNADDYDLAPLLPANQAAGRSGAPFVAPLPPASRPPARMGNSRWALIAAVGGLAACLLLLMVVGGVIAVRATLAMGGNQATVPPTQEADVSTQPTQDETPTERTREEQNSLESNPASDAGEKPQTETNTPPPAPIASTGDSPSVESESPDRTESTTGNNAIERTDMPKGDPPASDGVPDTAPTQVEEAAPAVVAPVNLTLANDLPWLSKPKDKETEPQAGTAELVSDFSVDGSATYRLIGPFALSPDEIQNESLKQDGFVVEGGDVYLWQLRDSIRGKKLKKTHVATLAANSGKLTFAWADEILSVKSEIRDVDDYRRMSNSLRLHVLSIESDQKKFYLPLMSPVPIETAVVAPPGLPVQRLGKLDMELPSLDRLSLQIQLSTVAPLAGIAVSAAGGSSSSAKKVSDAASLDCEAASVPAKELVICRFELERKDDEELLLSFDTSLGFGYVNGLVKSELQYLDSTETWSKGITQLPLIEQAASRKVSEKDARIKDLEKNKKEELKNPKSGESAEKANLEREKAEIEKVQQLASRHSKLIQDLNNAPLRAKVSILADYSTADEKQIPPVVIFESN